MKKIFFIFLFLFVCSDLFVFNFWVNAKEYPKGFIGHVQEFRLKNGMRFVVLEDHFAPVVSFVTVVGAGSINDPCGKTGLAHLLEHMAFKGTTRIGTKDWQKEKILTKRLDELYKRLKDIKERSEKIKILKEIKDVKKKLSSVIISNEFAKIIEKNGGEDLNAQTGKDYTMYYCSMPSNKVEMWFYLESERLKDPVWREFYTEKQVVLEERRMRVDSNPVGKLFENLLLIAYLHHPYRRPGIGWKKDIENIEKEDLTKFYHTFYNPENISVFIVGDIYFDEVKRFANKYFANIKPHSFHVSSPHYYEPIQKGRRFFVIKEKSHTPTLVRAYKGVSCRDKDFVSLDLLSVILGGGRTSLLYKFLVEENNLASDVFCFNGFPSSKYSSLFIIYVKPAKGVCLKDLSKTLENKLKEIKTKGIRDKDLLKSKKILLAEFWKDLDSNLEIAKDMAIYQVLYGDWRGFFEYPKKVKEVTVEDIKEVINKYLKDDRMVEGWLIE